MSTKFKVWLPNAITGTDILNESDFQNNSTRLNGYTLGQFVSAKLMNTELHNESLPLVALMDEFCTEDVDMTSSVQDLQNELNTNIAKKETVYENAFEISNRYLNSEYEEIEFGQQLEDGFYLFCCNLTLKEMLASNSKTYNCAFTATMLVDNQSQGTSSTPVRLVGYELNSSNISTIGRIHLTYSLVYSPLEQKYYYLRYDIDGGTWSTISYTLYARRLF